MFGYKNQALFILNLLFGIDQTHSQESAWNLHLFVLSRSIS